MKINIRWNEECFHPSAYNLFKFYWLRLRDFDHVTCIISKPSENCLIVNLVVLHQVSLTSKSASFYFVENMVATTPAFLQKSDK